jgi:hypothetical protein
VGRCGASLAARSALHHGIARCRTPGIAVVSAPLGGLPPYARRLRYAA